MNTKAPLLRTAEQGCFVMSSYSGISCHSFAAIRSTSSCDVPTFVAINMRVPSGKFAQRISVPNGPGVDSTSSPMRTR